MTVLHPGRVQVLEGEIPVLVKDLSMSDKSR